ncbi:4'-phosphopantetheinyl transferase superfamily protein [Paraglaciecola sp. Hal342]
MRELAQQFMHVNELNCLGTPEEVLYFYRTWSAKEAYFKALSGENQLSTVLSEIQIWPLLNNGGWQQTDLTDEHFSRIVVMQA